MNPSFDYKNFFPESDDRNVYIIAAFADDDVLENLDIEKESLDKMFGKCADKANYTSIGNATINDIINAFIQSKNKVGVFHYAGHANAKHLEFVDSQANASGIAGLMREQVCLPLVFLNGCSTFEQVNFFKEVGVGAIISTVVAVDDSQAVIFAERFYESFLLSNRTVEQSFDDAKKKLIMTSVFNKSEDDFRTNRKMRDAINIESVNRPQSKNRIPWTLEVSDDNLFSLTFNELTSFIYRRQLIKPYASWLVKQHSKMNIAGLKISTEIELEKVFVSLRGELSKSFEIFQTQKQLEEKIQTLEQYFAEHDLSDEEKQRHKSVLLGRSALMPTIEERDQSDNKNEVSGKNLNLLDAFLKYDKLVILGDPGTGKTTLARWLVLMFAKALASDHQELKVPSEMFSHDESTDYHENLISFGSVRLPVLIRVSEYAQALKKDTSLDLSRFIGRQSWLGNFPSFGPDVKERAYSTMEQDKLNNLMLEIIAKGEVLFILDGLDEVNDEEERKNVVKRISAFIEEEIDRPVKSGLKQRNKFIVTSRIAGYHISPLQHEELYHVTIQAMGDKAIQHFSSTWMLAAHNQAFHGKKKPFQIQYEAREITSEFTKLIFNPVRPGLRVLAGNPLLLTELGKIFLTEDRKLPDTRIGLYEKTARNMLDVWRGRIKGQSVKDLAVFEDKIFFVLENIAEYIHESYPTGLIMAEEIGDIVDKSLHEFYNTNPNIDRKSTVHAEKAAFLRVLSEEVGILAERATNLYGFLHLTFEEFFAAKKLLRDASKVTEQMLSKAYQPRWREPLMLAIGYLGKKLSIENRKKTLRLLLDETDPMGNLIPRSASLIALAIPEMNYVPDEDLINDVLLKLITAYANAGIADEGEVLRHHIEDTFIALKKNAAVWQEVKGVFRFVLTGKIHTANVKNAVAYLILRIDALDVFITQALMTARQHDSRAWQWPVHKALQIISINNAEWIGFSGLPMRKFLFEFPDFEEVINNHQDWLKIFSLLYGGIIPVKTEKEEVYVMSHKGIISDSFLTDQLIEYFEEGETPVSIIPFCRKYWQDDKLPVQDRIDCLLVLAVFANELPEMFFTISQTENHILRNALKERLDCLMVLSRKTFAAMVKKTFSGMQNILGEVHADDVYQLITALFKIDIAFNNQITNPIEWINAAPEHLKAKLLAEIWVLPFFSDDATYNMAVVLDTIGDGIENLGVDIITESLAVVQQVTVLPPQEKWHIERTPYMPQTKEEVLEKALSNLQALPTDFDFMKLWGLTVLKPLWSSYPRLTELCMLFPYSMQSRHCIEQISKMIYDAVGARTELDDNELEEKIGLDGYYMLLHTGPVIRMSSSKVIKYFLVKKDAKDNQRKSLDKIFEILSIIRETPFVLTDGQENEGIFSILSQAEKLINQLSIPEQKIQGYLKIIVYYSSSQDRNRLIQSCLFAVKDIKNLGSFAQCLRDLRPWTIADKNLTASWHDLAALLTREVDRSILDNRLRPRLSNLPSDGQNNMPIALTQTGALLKDLNQLFSLSQDTEQLWELLHYADRSILDEIIEHLYNKGLAAPIKLTMLGAMAISFLLDRGYVNKVKRLIICVGSPASEAVPLIKEWLDFPDPEIATFAALLMLEAGIITAGTFKYLDMVLFEKIFFDQDQVRNRVNLALSTQSFYTSRIGIEGLFLIEKSIRENWDKPYLTRGLAWIYEHLVFEDPDILSSLIEYSKGKGRKSERSTTLLGNIHLLTNTTFKLFLNALNTENNLIQKRLLKSAIWMLNKWNELSVKEAYHKEFRESLLRLSGSSDKDISLFAIDAIGYFRELMEEERRVLIQHTKNEDLEIASLALVSLGRADYKNAAPYVKEQLFHASAIIRNAAAEVMARYHIKMQSPNDTTLANIEMELQGASVTVLQALLDASKDRWWGGYSQKCALMPGIYFNKYPEVYEHFLRQVPSFLEMPVLQRNDYSYGNDIRWMHRSVLITAFASGAEKLPSTFCRGVQKNTPDLNQHLVNIVLKDGTFTNRMDALTCLSLLREMDADCTTAFTAALKDVSEVQTRAVSVMFRFWEISQKFIGLVSELMSTESYSARYAMVNMLASIGNYNKCDSRLRQAILNILYSKLNNPDFQVPIYLLRKKVSFHQREDGTKEEKDEGNSVEYMGRLDHEIYRRILEVAGIQAKKEN